MLMTDLCHDINHLAFSHRPFHISMQNYSFTRRLVVWVLMTMVFLKKIPKKYRIVGACCGFSIAVIGIGGWVIMPFLVDKLVDLVFLRSRLTKILPVEYSSIIFQNVILYKNSDQFQRWHTLPQPMEFKVYIFNVTNADDIQKGALPIVKEIGPYVYKYLFRKMNEICRF